MTWPTDAEREATERAIRSWTLDDAECIETQVDTILDALAPLVADRERAAAARALREAQHAWQTGEWTALTEAAKRPEQVQRILGTAQAVTEWLRDRADEMEAGEDA